MDFLVWFFLISVTVLAVYELVQLIQAIRKRKRLKAERLKSEADADIEKGGN